MLPHRLPQIALISLLLPCLAGCAAMVIAPEPPSEPRTVHLLTHGRHSTLLLTASDQTRVRYAYADWNWYVEGERGIRSGTRALLVPSDAALGRQVLAAQQPGERLEVAVGVGISQAFEFSAEAGRVDALLDSMRRIFDSSPIEPRYSPSVNLELVRHPRPYTFAYNSNHMVADWLRELGFIVNGSPALGNWKVTNER